MANNIDVDILGYCDDFEEFKTFIAAYPHKFTTYALHEMRDMFRNEEDENIHYFKAIFDSGLEPDYEFVETLLQRNCPKLLTLCMDIIGYQGFNLEKLIKDGYYDNVRILTKYGESVSLYFIDKLLYINEDLDAAEFCLSLGWQPDDVNKAVEDGFPDALELLKRYNLVSNDDIKYANRRWGFCITEESGDESEELGG